jgi:hypothetical protein
MIVGKNELHRTQSAEVNRLSANVLAEAPALAVWTAVTYCTACSFATQVSATSQIPHEAGQSRSTFNRQST